MWATLGYQPNIAVASVLADAPTLDFPFICHPFKVQNNPGTVSKLLAKLLNPVFHAPYTAEQMIAKVEEVLKANRERAARA